MTATVDSEVVYERCKRGHVRSPENVSKDGRCKECRKLYRKKYEQSEKGKEYRKRYEQSEKCKEYRKRYKQSEKGKESQKRYDQSEKGRESQKRYNRSEKGRESQKKYNRSESQKKCGRKCAAKRSANLVDGLILKRMGFRVNEKTPELMEAVAIKRLTIQLHREIKKCQTTN